MNELSSGLKWSYVGAFKKNNKFLVNLYCFQLFQKMKMLSYFSWRVCIFADEFLRKKQLRSYYNLSPTFTLPVRFNFITFRIKPIKIRSTMLGLYSLFSKLHLKPQSTTFSSSSFSTYHPILCYLLCCVCNLIFSATVSTMFNVVLFLGYHDLNIKHPYWHFTSTQCKELFFADLFIRCKLKTLFTWTVGEEDVSLIWHKPRNYLCPFWSMCCCDGRAIFSPSALTQIGNNIVVFTK